jgi:hypothetical protein
MISLSVDTELKISYGDFWMYNLYFYDDRSE